MIDGNGCVAMYQRTSKETKSGYSFLPHRTIASKDQWFMERLRGEYVGHVEGPSQTGKGYGSRHLWSLHVSSNEIRRLLPRVVPHLIPQRREAVLPLEAL